MKEAYLTLKFKSIKITGKDKYTVKLRIILKWWYRNPVNSGFKVKKYKCTKNYNYVIL